MDTHRLEDKIDRILEKITKLEIAQAAVADNTRRIKSLEDAIEPLKRQSSMVTGGAKLVALLGIIFGIVEALVVAFGVRK